MTDAGRRCLAPSGAGFGDVVKLTFLVLDIADLPAVRTARDAVIDTARPPASTAVQGRARVTSGLPALVMTPASGLACWWLSRRMRP